MFSEGRFRRTVVGLAIGLAAAVFPSSVLAGDPPAALARFERGVRDAVARVRPAVVKVSALRFPGRPGAAPGREATPYRSIGSGVIVDPRGYVLTNAHVVKDARGIEVRLWRARPADLVGHVIHRDEEKDLALIRLSGDGIFPCATFGRSSAVRVGDWVIAIGSPYGMEHSVSMGIVSDRTRSLEIGGRSYVDLIQTDAAINQGNSGGPLIDMRGDVVGISTAIYAPHGVFSGVGFAISAERALAYLRDAMPSNRIGRLAAETEMEPIRAGARPPHPNLGKCSGCHTFIGSTAGQTVTAAYQRPGQEVHSSRAAARDWGVIHRSAAFVLAAAVVFNMLGLGGGFFYVPILLMFGVGFHVASATSLFIITAAHISALFVFLRSRLIDYKLALALEPMTCLGAFLGGISSSAIGESSLSLMFGSILALSAFLMHREPWERAALPLALSPRFCWQRSFGAFEYTIDLSVGLPVAFTIGYFGGMLGFAGGILKIPMMVLLFGVPIKVAIATSSLMVTLTSMVGCIGQGFAGHFDPLLSIPLALAAVVGAQIGARFTIRADRQMLKRLFAVVLLVAAVWMFGRVL